MRRLLAVLIPLGTLALLVTLSGRGAAADQTTTIYRDEFGIPHIFAPTLDDAAFAVGYAQAEDRLEELLKNYRRATGTMAEVFGPGSFRDDLTQRVMRHAEISQASYDEISPKMRGVIESYPERHQAVHEGPSRAGSVLGPGDPAVGRRRARPLHHLELADGRGRRRPRAAPASSFGPLPYRGSNEMLIAPKRTAMNAPIAIIDPHVQLVRPDAVLRGPDLHARVQRLGRVDPGRASADPGPQPLLLGRDDHRRARHVGYLRGRDQPGQPQSVSLRRPVARLHRPQDDDRRQERRQARSPRRSRSTFSHHGPIVARKGGKAYAMAIPYCRGSRTDATSASR